MKLNVKESFKNLFDRATDFFNGNHLSTIMPIYLAQNLEPNYIRERLDTKDGDFLDLDWVNQNAPMRTPTIILFHGTEGNSKSHYAKRLMCYLEEVGWRGVVAHFRSCSEEINKTPRFYHAGETCDIAFVVKTMKERFGGALYAIGVSLGGNALLKFLGERPECNLLDAAVAISVPFDLRKCVQHLDNNILNRRLYVKSFLDSVLPKMQTYAEIFANFHYVNKKIDTLDEFNNTYLCQSFGFKNADEYYDTASSKPFLKHITTPTVILQAANDPMILVDSWPKKEELAPSVRFIGTKYGGHAGFLSLSPDYKQTLFRLPQLIVKLLGRYSNKPIVN